MVKEGERGMDEQDRAGKGGEAVKGRRNNDGRKVSEGRGTVKEE